MPKKFTSPNPYLLQLLLVFVRVRKTGTLLQKLTVRQIEEIAEEEGVKLSGRTLRKVISGDYKRKKIKLETLDKLCRYTQDLTGCSTFQRFKEKEWWNGINDLPKKPFRELSKSHQKLIEQKILRRMDEWFSQESTPVRLLISDVNGVRLSQDMIVNHSAAAFSNLNSKMQVALEFIQLFRVLQEANLHINGNSFTQKLFYEGKVEQIIDIVSNEREEHIAISGLSKVEAIKLLSRFKSNRTTQLSGLKNWKRTYLMALMAELSGNYEHALKLYKQVFLVVPAPPVAQRLAVIYRRLSEWTLSEKYFQFTLRKLDHYEIQLKAECIIALSQINFQQEKLDKAKSFLEQIFNDFDYQVTKLMPILYANAVDLYAEILEKESDIDGAITYLNKSIEIDQSLFGMEYIESKLKKTKLQQLEDKLPF